MTFLVMTLEKNILLFKNIYFCYDTLKSPNILKKCMTLNKKYIFFDIIFCHDIFTKYFPSAPLGALPPAPRRDPVPVGQLRRHGTEALLCHDTRTRQALQRPGV